MPWETDESSGFLTNFTGVIEESYFGTDPRYNNGETTLALWQVKVDKVLQEYEGEVPEIINLSFPLGSGWISENGDTVEHKNGKTKFHASSVYGKIIDSIMDRVANYGANASATDGEELVADLTALQDVLPAKGDPTNADIWTGLAFEFREVLYDFGPDKAKKDGSHITSRRTMPIRYLGEGTAAETTATEAPAATATTTNGKSGTPFDGIVEDETIKAQLVEILNSAPDYNTFVDRCIAVPEVEKNDALLAKVLDNEAGPWAKAHA